MTGAAPLVAGVELGGTKCIAVLARDAKVVARAQWPTGDDPAATLGTIAVWLREGGRAEPISALGIASFGPVIVDPLSPLYGRIVNTPKPGWSGTGVVDLLTVAVDGPVMLDTDVTGAALAEARWGVAHGCGTCVYLTIGTGIGGGIVIDGRPVHGTLHPEIGHIRVRRTPDDSFAGICRSHGDCLEGIASGPAIAARTGTGADRIAPEDPVWQQVGAEIAELVAMLILTLAPHRIVIGGGVGQGQPTLIGHIRRATERTLGGYVPGIDSAALETMIVYPKFGADAGVYGSIALAYDALAGLRKPK